jgi:hypothetical protein
MPRSQLLNYGESKVRVLIITGQLRSIKDGRFRRILPEWVEAYFKIAPSRPRTSGDESKSQWRGFDLPVRNGFAAYVWITIGAQNVAIATFPYLTMANKVRVTGFEPATSSSRTLRYRCMDL